MLSSSQFNPDDLRVRSGILPNLPGFFSTFQLFAAWACSASWSATSANLSNWTGSTKANSWWNILSCLHSCHACFERR